MVHAVGFGLSDESRLDVDEPIGCSLDVGGDRLGRVVLEDALLFDPMLQLVDPLLHYPDPISCITDSERQQLHLQQQHIRDILVMTTHML